MQPIILTGTALAVLLAGSLGALANGADLPTPRPERPGVTATDDGKARRIVVSGPADIVITVERNADSRPTVRWFPDNRRIVLPPEPLPAPTVRWLDLDDFGGAPAPVAFVEEDAPARQVIHITVDR
ncbi:MAG: hypothetical protein R3D02_01305 [Hyphomicrobiales bacterium]